MAKPLSPFELDFNPYSLPPAFLKAIGLVTAAAAQTENEVEQLIAGCLGIDFEYGMAVTLHMAMPQRFSVVRAAAEIRLDDLDALDEQVYKSPLEGEGERLSAAKAVGVG